MATILALSLPAFAIGLGGLIGLFCVAIYTGVLASYYVQTVAHVGRGRERLPFSSEVISWGGLVGILLRDFFTIGLCFAPAIALRWWAPEQIVLQILGVSLGAALIPAAVLSVVGLGLRIGIRLGRSHRSAHLGPDAHDQGHLSSPAPAAHHLCDLAGPPVWQVLAGGVGLLRTVGLGHSSGD